MSRQTLNTENFFRDCHKKFGDRFDYSETIYKTLKKPIKVTCRKHHKTFEVPEARNHLRPESGGCSECEQEAARLPLKDFIKRANDKHGAKYEYSRVNYDNLNQKVWIKCPLHGWFDQKAAHHLSGHECEECGFFKRGKSKSATVAKGIIERFKKKHGNKYDYSKVDYQGFDKLVTIICPIPGHGEFRQSPVVHLMGCGCQICGGNPRLTQSEFLRKAHKVHGNRYDYSLVVVDGVDKDVEIICRKHEIFWQTPYSHLNGANCNRCAGIAPKTREEAIDSFRATHGKKYDYSLVDYKNNSTNVIVICPVHNRPFPVTPSNHRRGKGCPDCAEYGFDTTKPAILYYARIDDVTRGTLYKIGITNRSFDDRYQSEDKAKMTLVKTWEFDVGLKAKQREAEIIRKYIDFQYTGLAVISTGNVDQHREVFTSDILSLDHDDI